MRFFLQLYQGTLSDRIDIRQMPVNIDEGARLDILVENEGRNNGGPKNEFKVKYISVVVHNDQIYNSKSFKITNT